MVTLLRKKGNIEVDFPKGWEVIQTIFREGQKQERPIYDLVKEALDQPMYSHRLENILKSGDHVAIVVDDVTRPTPIRDHSSSGKHHTDRRAERRPCFEYCRSGICPRDG